jgi:hypothetical protein
MKFKVGDRVVYRTPINTLNPATVIEVDVEHNRVDIQYDDEDPLERLVYNGDWYDENELEFYQD